MSTAIGFAALLAGCVDMPMTASDFRDAARKSNSGKVETFEVKRSVADVGRTFQRKAAECLNFKLTSTPVGPPSAAAPGAATVKSTVIASADQVELDVQVKAAGNIAKAPPDGNYLLVAVGNPVGKDRTRIEIYRGAGGPIAQSIRAWANGDERGCPDPKRTFDR